MKMMKLNRKRIAASLAGLVLGCFAIPFPFLGHVADPTGKPGLIFAAGNVKRWSLGLVACRGLYYEGGLSSAGYEIFILRLPFAWVPLWARMLWISKAGAAGACR